MRRSHAGAGLLAALILLALLLLLPALAGAADDSYVGTYEGWGEGTGSGGGKATSKVTIWLEDLGDQVRVTIKAHRIGVAFDFEGAEGWDGDTLVVPINVKKRGVKVNGTITVQPDGENWILTGSGSGKVITYKGKGTVLAVRVATGVKVPGVGDQIKGGLEAIFGGPPDAQAESAPEEATEGGELKAPKPPAEVEQVSEASLISPAEATPPIPEEDKWYAALMLTGVIFLLFIFFVFI
jgi:hypothetical protein